MGRGRVAVFADLGVTPGLGKTAGWSVASYRQDAVSRARHQERTPWEPLWINHPRIDRPSNRRPNERHHRRPHRAVGGDRWRPAAPTTVQPDDRTGGHLRLVPVGGE